jgi:hypothetical protein
LDVPDPSNTAAGSAATCSPSLGSGCADADGALAGEATEDPEPVEIDADAVISDKSCPDPDAGADESTPESVLLP